MIVSLPPLFFRFTSDATECVGEGGGFAGPVDNGKAKGGHTGTSVSIYVLQDSALLAKEEEEENPDVKWEKVCSMCTIPVVPNGAPPSPVPGNPGVSEKKCFKACEEDPDCNYVEYGPSQKLRFSFFHAPVFHTGCNR